MNSLAADDAELVQLLAQLLRVVNPDSAGPGNGAPRNGGRDRPGRAEPGPPAEPGPSADPGPPAEPGSPGAAGPHEAAIPVLSASEARALIELVAARGIAQGQLGALLGLEKSTVSRLAAGLERKGWIQRGRDTANQRYIRLYLTPEGSRVAARVWQAWQSRQARIIGALTPEERAGLAAGLRGLVRGLAAEGLLADTSAAAGRGRSS
ncbi:MAG TPA: MarR family winged helix-turn-helix transcriptional regulator [Streptosporangiaceae bacterium]|nr:MarR family winged helix-turn-helix transcriptional regulator [Streptosporangiaceae bacterium]